MKLENELILLCVVILSLMFIVKGIYLYKLYKAKKKAKKDNTNCNIHHDTIQGRTNDCKSTLNKH